MKPKFLSFGILVKNRNNKNNHKTVDRVFSDSIMHLLWYLITYGSLVKFSDININCEIISWIFEFKRKIGRYQYVVINVRELRIAQVTSVDSQGSVSGLYYF